MDTHRGTSYSSYSSEPTDMIRMTVGEEDLVHTEGSDPFKDLLRISAWIKEKDILFPTRDQHVAISLILTHR
jgi:hypothetical protein